jgi:hypothetical protein
MFRGDRQAGLHSVVKEDYLRAIVKSDICSALATIVYSHNKADDEYLGDVANNSPSTVYFYNRNSEEISRSIFAAR